VIDEQRKAFAAKGVRYEVWPASRIIKKLRPHKGIVSSFFTPPEFWVSIICGESASVALPATVASAVIYQNGQLSAVLMGIVESDMARIREAWSEGRRGDAMQLLAEAKGNDAAFAALPPSLQGGLLRFEAISALESGQHFSAVEQIVQRAASLDPSGPGNTQLAAILELHRHHPREALKLLESSRDLDSIHLKVSILLSLGDSREARVLTSQIPVEHWTAETHRLLALERMAAKDLAGARLSVQKALELRPKAANVVYLAAVLDYLASLAVAPPHLPSWPDPVDWTLTRRDDETLERLVNADHQFRHLLQSSDLTQPERSALEIWRLASLANHPNRQDEAAEYCLSLIDPAPTRAEAIGWAIVRRFDLDLHRSEAVLRDLVIDGQATANQAVALIAIYCHYAQWRKAERVIDQQRELLVRDGGTNLWVHWKAQVLGFAGKVTDALKLVDLETGAPELLSLAVRLLRSMPEAGSVRRAILDRCETLYRTTGDPQHLLAACDLAAGASDWAYIADHSEEILSAISTAGIVGQLAGAAYNATRPETCLRLLDRGARLFPSGRLPNELRQLRIQCQRMTGALPAAVSEAESLARDEPSLENLIGLSQVYFSIGDFRRLSVVARSLLRLPDLGYERCLRLGWQTQWEDPTVARELWRRAIGAGIPDEAVIPAIQLGYALGLDAELDTLIVRMQVLGRERKSGIQAATLEEIIEYTRQFQQHAAELFGAYDRAETPIHFLGQQLNIPLAEFYHNRLDRVRASEDLSAEPYLLARYGGRPATEGAKAASRGWRLNLDISALLLAAHFDFLSMVETAYRPLRISSHAIPSLVRMRDQLTTNQPKKLEAGELILNCVANGAVSLLKTLDDATTVLADMPASLSEKWKLLFAAADQIDGGFLVEFIPIPTVDGTVPLTSLPPTAQPKIINCRTIIEALYVHGPLSTSEYSAVLRQFGSEGGAPVFDVPSPGANLIFSGTTIELLATSGALAFACEQFKCYIDSSEIEKLRNEQAIAAHQAESAQWVAELIDRVSRGVSDGRYEVIVPAEPLEREQERYDPDAACLMSLLHFAPDDNDVLWIDDRWANQHLQGGTVRIVDIVDVLRALIADGALQEGQYYELLSQLRSSNVWFLPIEKSEILYYLSRARIDEAGVVETNELKALRRGISSMILRCALMDKPSPQQAASGIYAEGKVVLGLIRAVSDALAETWATGDTDQARVARSDWILENLYVDQHILRRLAGFQATADEEMSLTAGRFALLISRVFSIPIASDRGERAGDYINWLVRRILDGPLTNETGLVEKTAEVVKGIFLEVAPKSLRNKRARAIMATLHRHFESLPGPIRDQLSRDADFAKQMRLRKTMIVDLEGVRFERASFLRGAREAVNGRRAEVSEIRGRDVFVFEPLQGEDEGKGFLFRPRKDAPVGQVTEPLLGLLRDSPSLREQILWRNRPMFDMPVADFDGFVADVASTEDVERRMDKAEEATTRSGEYFYRLLHKKLSGTFQRQDLMPPAPSVLLSHFRIFRNDYDVPIPRLLSIAATALLKSETIDVAVERLTRFPVPLPATLMDRILALESGAKEALVRRLLKTVNTPLSVFHCAHILEALAEPRYSRLARRIVSNALSDSAAGEFGAFRSSLLWSMQEFEVWPSARALPSSLRLALTWAHAHEVFVTFKALGSPMEWLEHTFDAFSNRVRFGPVDLESGLRSDLSHPIHMSRASMILGGLDYAFAPSDSRPFPESLKQPFSKIALQETEVGAFPSVPLLLDTRLAKDSLGVLWGGERRGKLPSMVPDGEVANAVLSEMSGEQVLTSLEANRQDWTWWIRLHAVVGDFRLPSDLSARFQLLAMGTDFAAIAAHPLETGYVALHVASTQARHMASEAVRNHLTASLEATAAVFKSGEKLAKENEIVLILLDCALSIAQCAPQEGKIYDEFARLVGRLIQKWPAAAKVARRGIQRMCEETPFSENDLLWQLNLALRSRK
jgi:hypothetical protein